jgi:Uma2 family endonuclease
MGQAELKYITQEEYLSTERLALDKHEYFEGEIFAMSGAQVPHVKITGNTFFNLALRLKGKKCQPYGSDLRIHIPKNTLFTYPDISIFCDEIETTDDNFDTATNPSVIFEILSPSTRGYDKDTKFTLYRAIESLSEYILIDSERVLVEKYIRNDNNSWQFTEYTDLSQILKIETVEVEILLNEIYDAVKFKPRK